MMQHPDAAHPAAITAPPPHAAGATVPGSTTHYFSASAYKPFFENLDTLRFISFLVVFLFHVRFYEWVASHTSNAIVLTLTRLMCSGGWGVTFFFALSGFLITWLLLTEIRRNGRINVGAFYMRRVLRIWPLYALVAITGIVLLPLAYRSIGRELIFDYNIPLYACFLSNFGVIALDPLYNSSRSFPLIMNITWSVSIEEQFYLIWPLGFILPAGLRRFVPQFFIAISVIAALLLSPDRVQIYSSSFTRIGEIAIGACFAATAFHGPGFMRFIRKMPRVLITVVYLAAFTVIDLSFRLHIEPIAEYSLHMIGAMLFSLIILEQNFSEHSIFKLGRLRLFGRLGKISYGLYMLHPIAMLTASLMLQFLFHTTEPVASGLQFILTAFALSIGFALASYYIYELPILRLKERFAFIRLKKMS